MALHFVKDYQRFVSKIMKNRPPDAHFVKDYQRLVSKIMKNRPLDEAMSLAVGGAYEHIGQIELDIVRHAGLKDRMSLVDIGCGSGRLSSALSSSEFEIDYLGTDIVQKLLDYAAKKSRRSYQFKLHSDLSVPVEDESVDMICAFSVFTHLYHHETYIYMQDALRALRPDGKLVFSFLEFAESGHWGVFESTVRGRKRNNLPHLNAFIERPAIKLWAEKLGFDVAEFINATLAVEDSQPLGQSVVVLVKA